MTRRLLLLLALIPCLPLRAVAQEPPLDPALRVLLALRERAVETTSVDPPATRFVPGAGAAPAASLWSAALEERPTGAVVRALVRLGPGGEAALRRHGAWIGARAGDVVTARIPLDALDAVVREGGIRAVEGAVSLEAPAAPAPVAAVSALDSSRADVRVEKLRSRVGDVFEGLTGRNVIVGIYDTGLDLQHPDFRRDGRSRVLYAWDQTEEGEPPGAVGDHRFDYGYDCDRAAIDSGACPLDDVAGHGTHVAGIAGGDGSATGNGLDPWRYTGVAPESDLIVVRGSRSLTFVSDQVVDGVAYILARAAALGRPAVVNLSLGAQSGPHDGSTIFERALDNLVGPGRVLVASAGNQGANDNEEPAIADPALHAQGTTAGPGDHGLRVPEYSPRPGAANDGAILELWYDGADSLAVAVSTPAGRTLRVATGDTASLATPEGTILIDNAFGGPSPLNGDHQALVVIVDTDGAAPPASGTWGLAIEPAPGASGADYHLWLVGAAFVTPIAASLVGGTTNSHLVSAPGTADRAIAVAAHVTRHRWPSLGGDEVVFPVREPLGDIAFFSSPGPRRDGVLKPEISAPGKVVQSAMAARSTLWNEPALRFLIEADGVHAGLFGTSMAAPHLTGAVALLLQLDPSLTPEDVRELLLRSGRVDAHVLDPPTPGTNGVPNAQWGYGKLDVAAAVERLRPEGLVAAGERIGVSQNPVRGRAVLINYREPPSRVGVYTLTARRVRGFSAAEIGPLSTVWALDTDRGAQVANGAYVIVAEFDDGPVLRKIFVARP